MSPPYAQSEGDMLALVARININKVKQYEAFQEVERNFNAYDFDDVHFYAVPRSDTEPRDGKNYLIDNPPELWLFHGMNNGTVRPRVKGKAKGRSDPIVYKETKITPWNGGNLTSFAVANLMPNYFTFPPFPEERGYANEVQRARLAARSQWPKLMLINTEENSENVDQKAYDKALTEAGIFLKQSAQAILFRMTLPQSDLLEVYQSFGIHDPMQAKAHLLQDNAVHVAYFDPVSLLFGSQYYTIDNVNTTKKIAYLVMQMIAKQPSTLGNEFQSGLRTPLRTPQQLKEDKAAGHARTYLSEASFAGMMAAIEGQKPFPGAIGSSEWRKKYEIREDGTFYAKDDSKGSKKSGKSAKKSIGGGGKKTKRSKTAAPAAGDSDSSDLGTASTDDASKQCKAGDASCAGGAAAAQGKKKTGKKSEGHDEL